MVYFLYIYPPTKYRKDESVNLQLEVEGNFLHGFERFWDSSKYHSDGNITLTKKFSPPGSRQYVSLERLISGEQMKYLKVLTMPGVRIRWNYTENLAPDSYTKSKSYTEFKR